jgi:starvation-inducible outer membrane lipoprotein
MYNLSFFRFLVLMALAGCGPAISTGLVQQAAREPGAPGNFAALRANPEKYQGKLVILGGEVISASRQDGKSLLAVNQRELDPRLQPYGPGYGGTFYVESDEYLSPSSYAANRKVTVAGVVRGRVNGAPLLQARQIHLGDYPPWEKWYYPVPREWYGGDPALEYWFTPPYFDPWRTKGGI